MEKRLANSLKLVGGPYSNQECEWLEIETEFRDYVLVSKLYMLAQKEEAFYQNFNSNVDEGELHFQIVMSGQSPVDCILKYSQIEDELSAEGISGIAIYSGEKIIKFVGQKDNEEVVPVYWTPEQLLQKIDDLPVQLSSEIPDEYYTYDLYYVGISHKGDSFSRLFDQGHKARSRILGNEHPKRTGARITDELFIFLFTFENMQIASVGPEGDIDAFADLVASPKMVPDSQLAKDCEKAFIKVLDTKYNRVKYKDYPKSEDGIDWTKFVFGSYGIKERISFNVPGETFNCRKIDVHGHVWPKGDIIAIENESVILVKRD